MDRTSRETDVRVLEASRQQARSVESLSRLSISTRIGVGRSSMDAAMVVAEVEMEMEMELQRERERDNNPSLHDDCVRLLVGGNHL